MAGLPAQRWNDLWRHASISRWARQLQSYSFTIALEQVAIQEGLRAASAVVPIVVAAVWLDWPRLSWAAFSAFWACLADPGGRDGSRFGVMGLFAGAGTVAIFIASATAGVSPLLAALMLVPLVFVGSLSAMYGVETSRVGTLVCVAAVVAVAFPSAPAAALRLAGLFLLGGLWAMLLCIGIWRIHPYAPARRAIATVFAQLGGTILEVLGQGGTGGAAVVDWDTFNAEHRRSIRATIERTRAMVAALETSELRYHSEIDIADRVFAAFIAMGHALAERGSTVADTGERDLLHRLLLLLAEAQHQVEQRTPQAALLESEAAALQAESVAVGNVLGRGIAAAAAALRELAQGWQRAAGADRAQALAPTTAPLLRPIPTTILRHAARVAIAVVTSYAIASSLNLTFSYWATVGTVVVLQPDSTLIWQRTIERVLGSVAGGVLATLLMFALPSKIAVLGLMFPLAAATIAFRLVNYTVFVMFVTALFVLVTELLQPAAGIASIRVLDNVIGSLTGLAASLLPWRQRGARGVGEVLADAIRANFAYAARVVATTGTAAELDSVRRAAGIASGDAEILQHRMMLEGQRRRAHLAQMEELLRALRRLAGSAAATALAGPQAHATRAVAVAQQGAALAGVVADPSGAALPGGSDAGTQEEIDRAIRGVRAAAAAYVAAFHER